MALRSVYSTPPRFHRKGTLNMDIMTLAVIVDTQDWDDETKAVMMAIAKAESALKEDAKGDKLENYRGYWNQLYGPYSCDGFLAFGLWQIFTYWHAQKLTDYTHSKSPCDWAQWLQDPQNNVKIAADILQAQGFSAWSAYNQQTHLDHLTEARLALAALKVDEYAPWDDGHIESLKPVPSLLRHLAHVLEEFLRKATAPS